MTRDVMLVAIGCVIFYAIAAAVLLSPRFMPREYREDIGSIPVPAR